MSERRPVVAIDDGYDQTKVYTESGGFVMPTLFSFSKRQTANLGVAELGHEGHYQIDDLIYSVGDVREPQDTRYDEFPYSPANLAVAIHAVRRAGVEAADLNVVTGLPVNRYYTSAGEVREESLKKKVQAWRREVRYLPVNGHDADAVVPKFVGVQVISEAVGAWFDFVVGDDGELCEDLVQRQVAVVDIGGRTTDIAVVENAEVVMENSGTTDHGVLDIYAGIERRLKDELNLPTDIPRQRIVSAVASGVLQLGPREHDIRALLDEERRLLAERVRTFVQTRIGSEALFIDKVLFVGGGAQVLKRELQGMYPQMGIPVEPHFANARGMYKFGQMRFNAA